MGCHFLLQEIFPTQGLNPGLPHCRQMLYWLNHQGSLVGTGTGYIWWYLIYMMVKKVYVCEALVCMGMYICLDFMCVCVCSYALELWNAGEASLQVKPLSPWFFGQSCLPNLPLAWLHWRFSSTTGRRGSYSWGWSWASFEEEEWSMDHFIKS